MHRLCSCVIPVVLVSILAAPVGRVGQCAEFLSDERAGVFLKHQQQWGDFGLDTAAAKPGTTGTPLRIGDRTFKKGLGHHANGEIVVDLRGQFSEFRALVGVQWQGGNKGSVVFRVEVDGDIAFESGPTAASDLDDPSELSRPHLPLANRRAASPTNIAPNEHGTD